MINDVVKNLFAKTPPSQVDATVIRRVSAVRYEVEDDAGRRMLADSTATWRPGNRVIIQRGRIVSRGGARKTIKNYEV